MLPTPVAGAASAFQITEPAKSVVAVATAVINLRTFPPPLCPDLWLLFKPPIGSCVPVVALSQRHFAEGDANRPWHISASFPDPYPPTPTFNSISRFGPVVDAGVKADLTP